METSRFSEADIKQKLPGIDIEDWYILLYMGAAMKGNKHSPTAITEYTLPKNRLKQYIFTVLEIKKFNLYSVI